MGRRPALKCFGNLFILPGLVILFRLWPFIPLIYCNLSFAVNESSINKIYLFKCECLWRERESVFWRYMYYVFTVYVIYHTLYQVKTTISYLQIFHNLFLFNYSSIHLSVSWLINYIYGIHLPLLPTAVIIFKSNVCVFVGHR